MQGTFLVHIVDKWYNIRYIVQVQLKMYGKEYMGVGRSTFVFNKDGEQIKEFRDVKAKGHAEEILEFIKRGK